MTEPDKTPKDAPETTPEGVKIVSRFTYANGTVQEQLGPVVEGAA